MVAVLCKVFGISDIQLAEDIVSETFLTAAETWGKKGLPENQVAWLYSVAKNKAKDHFKREQLRINKINPVLKKSQDKQTELELDFGEESIKDGQLKMIFAICHPLLKTDTQIALALRILCGFGIDEIVSALFSNKSTINKKLYRGKEKLREEAVSFDLPEADEIGERLETVLKTVYLLFNEGYYASNPSETIRKDLCLEAMRLNLLLLENKTCNKPQTNALLSLMCFHSSRFEARLNPDGHFILYDEQDENLWDQELIKKGEYYLNIASSGDKLSKYHLEAAIAYWHTQKQNPDRWESILQLYNLLLQLQYSPAASLNRTFAISKARSNEEALKEALKLKLEKNHLYHILLAELYKISSPKKNAFHLQKALELCKSEYEKKIILEKLGK